MSESRFGAPVAPPTARPRAPQRARMAATLALSVLAVSGCQATESDSTAPAAAGSPSASPVTVTTGLPARGEVPVDQVVAVQVAGAQLSSVNLRSPSGEVAGDLDRAENTWQATGRLEPDTAYALASTLTRRNGTSETRTTRFRTAALTLDQQTYASIAPLDGETVGVGMPVIVTFDLPVTDRAEFERHMTVTAVPQQSGTWHWLDDREVHWRPKSYWESGSEVSVDIDVNSLNAGNGIYGQESRHIEFTVGKSHVYRVDAKSHEMQVFREGSLLRTLPITLGKAGFTTRSGTKVIIEKFDTKRMNSETVGISSDDPEHYDIDDVQWAMRLTYSGEFIHAAPWSVGSQGSANVSHGCTGMSPEDAGWLYAMSRRGDVVEYTGTGRPMTLKNGFGDWNATFAEYAAGSALS